MGSHTYIGQDDRYIQMYDRWYADNYMFEWPVEKKSKIIEIVQGAQLAPYGRFLDFGCGQGVLTYLLKSLLPNWEIYGYDFSEHAIRRATERYAGSGITFITKDELNGDIGKFDFIFTHHVLEHVESIEAVFLLLESLSGPESQHLHILPCGNPGSLEYRIAHWVKEGVDPKRGNRFFYEEEGHLRRLTSHELIATALQHGFRLRRAYFSNQFWGTLSWVSRKYIHTILIFTGRDHKASFLHFIPLLWYRFIFLLCHALQYPTLSFQYHSSVKSSTRQASFWFRFITFMHLFSFPFYRGIAWLSALEWQRKKNNPAGSEMFMLFQRI